MQPRIKVLAIISGLVLLGLFGLTIYNATQFRVTKMSPDNKNFPATLSIMEIQFSKPLDVGDLQKRSAQGSDKVVKASFKGNNSLSIKEKSIVITFGSTPLPGKYALSLQNIKAKGGKLLNQELALIVKDIPYDKMTKAEKEQYNNSLNIGEDVPYSKYPILRMLPFETANYKVDRDPLSDGEDSAGPLTVVITMKFFAPGNNAIPATPEETNQYLADLRKYRTQALDEIQKKGYKLNDYKIRYSEPELVNEFPQGHP